jgi:hypothetical protein
MSRSRVEMKLKNESYKKVIGFRGSVPAKQC